MHCAWLLWTGSATAMESFDYGNMGPLVSWNKAGTFEDQARCNAGLAAAIAEHMKANPGAVRRRKDLVVQQKQVGGEDDMVVHTSTRFICLPDDAAAPDSKPPPLPDDQLREGPR